MAVITMNPKTRIRVINRALELLEEFNTNLRRKMAAGEVKISTALQIQSRKNAEEEARLRRRLKDLEAEVDQDQLLSKSNKTVNEDILVAALQAQLVEAFTMFQPMTSPTFEEGQNILRLARQDEDRLALDFISAGDIDLDEIAIELTNMLFSVSIDIPSGPNAGTALFMAAPSEPPSDIPEDFEVCSFHIYIAPAE